MTLRLSDLALAYKWQKEIRAHPSLIKTHIFLQNRFTSKCHNSAYQYSMKNTTSCEHILLLLCHTDSSSRLIAD